METTAKEMKPFQKKIITIKRVKQDDMRQSLLEHFKFHVGEDEATDMSEIFQAVIGVNISAIDTLTRFYWEDVVRKVMRALRREDKCFIIQKKGKHFVLKTQDEADYYKNICTSSIDKMEKAKIRADNWVAEGKWKTFNQEKTKKDKRG